MLALRNLDSNSLKLRTNLGQSQQSNQVVVSDSQIITPLRVNLGIAEPVVCPPQTIIEYANPISINPNHYKMRTNLIDGSGGAIADAFDPTQISSCQLWLDAQDVESTIFFDSGFVWKDKSGNNRHAYQISSSLSPTIASTGINGKRALRFNGSQYLIQPVIATSYTGLTIFAVFLISTANGFVLWGHRSETTRLIQLTTQTTTEVRFQLRSNANALQTISQTISASHQIATGILNVSGNNHNLYINNAAGTANITNFSGQNFDSTLETIGGTFSTIYSSFFDGWIGELIIYNRALNTNEIGAINAGLATKWG